MDWWDLADAKHEDSKADRCKCGGRARYWLPGDVYVCWPCYKARGVQVEVSVVYLCKTCGAEVDGWNAMCMDCASRL